MNFLKKTIFSASYPLKDKLPDDNFLEMIKDTQGIFYNKNKAIFTLTESLPEIKFRQIIYWLRKDDYKKNLCSGIESILIALFEKIHQKDFFINWARESKSSRFAYLLPGAGIFCGFDPSPAFWLEWEIFFTIIDPIKAQSNYLTASQSTGVTVAIPIAPPDIVVKGIVWGVDPPQAVVDDEVVTIGSLVGEDGTSQVKAIDDKGVHVEHQVKLCGFWQVALYV